AQVHLRHRRRGLLGREGDHHRLDRAGDQEPGRQRLDHEAGPVPQRRPGHDVALPARRGLRHRRRGRNRPRPGALRALHRREPVPRLERHHRPSLLGGDRQGAAGRLPGRHDPGHPPHHQRDQAPDPPRHPSARVRRGDLRSRRHGRRHRGPGLHRGDPPDAARGRAGERALHPRHPAARDRRHRRAEDQTDPAERARATLGRHPTGRDRLPGRPGDPGGDEGEDRPLLRRRPGSGGGDADRVHHLRGAADPGRKRPRRLHRPPPGVGRPRPGSGRVAGPGRTHQAAPEDGSDRPGRQVRRPARRLHERHRVLDPRRVGPRRQRRGGVDQLRDRDPGRTGAGAAPRLRRRRAGRLWAARDRGQGRRVPLRPRARAAVPGVVLRPAHRGDRRRAQRLRPNRRQLLGDRPRNAAPGDRPDAGPARGRDGRHDAPRPLALPPGAGHQSGRRLRRGHRVRAPPAPVRGQQRVPGGAGRGRADRQRLLAGRHPGRDHGAARPPLFRRRPVPPRVPLSPNPAPSPVPRLRRRRQRHPAGRRPTRLAAGRSAGRGGPLRAGAGGDERL
ncbi:MAG: CTP synthase, partial [uncultured Thermomicrobiales bacterium]